MLITDSQLLAKEIRVWSQLCHPNVLELLGYVIEENGFPSLISPWIANGTALEFVRAHPELDVCPIVSQSVKRYTICSYKGRKDTRNRKRSRIYA